MFRAPGDPVSKVSFVGADNAILAAYRGLTARKSIPILRTSSAAASPGSQ